MTSSQETPKSQTIDQLRSPFQPNGTEATLNHSATLNGEEYLAQQPPGDDLNMLSPAQANDELGRLGNYRVLRKLGAGGMGVVLLGEDTKLGRLAALKVMKPGIAANFKSRERFLREAQSAARVHHDHVMPILHIDDEHEAPFIAMPYLEGETLANLLRRRDELALAEILRVAREIALGLEAAHASGLVHRDIKPSNIWLEGPQRRVRILDFGLARHAFGKQELTSSGQLIGTPAYMAPEQAAGVVVDHRCDLFSLGTLIYCMVTGVQPFQGADIISTLNNLANKPVPPLENSVAPKALSDLTKRLMDRDPEQRPKSAADVAIALQKIAMQIDALGMRRASKSNGFRWAIGIVAGAVLLLACAQIVIRIRHKDGKETQIVVPADATVSIEPSPKVENEWMKRVRSLPPDQRMQAVIAEMKQRNPGFDGNHQLKIVDGEIRELTIAPHMVADISPLTALGGLRRLSVSGRPGKFGRLTTVEPLRGMKLESLNLAFNRGITDIGPLSGMPLESLSLFETCVADLSPLRGMKLKSLWCNWTKVTDLEPLRGMPLEELVADHSPIQSLEPLRGAPLKSLYIGSTGVKDLSPLQDTSIQHLAYDFDPNRDADILTRIKTLEKINHRNAKLSIGEASRSKRPFEPLDPMWVRKLQSLPAAEQVGMFEKELRRRNSAFVGKVESLVAQGKIVSLKFTTDNVADISPVAALVHLKQLSAQGNWGKGTLADLSPIKELPLDVLEVRFNQIVDLACLEKLRLLTADFRSNRIASLNGLNGLRCTQLLLSFNPLTTLAGIREPRMEILDIDATGVSSLDPLRGAPIKVLHARFTRVDDFSPLESSPMVELECNSWNGLAQRALQSLPHLKTIQQRPVDEYRRALEVAEHLYLKPLEAGWAEKIQAMPAAMQWKEVTQELVRRNPDFQPKFAEFEIVDGKIASAMLPPAEVGDLTPIAALKDLQSLTLNCKMGRSRIVELQPLAGLKLTKLEVVNNPFRSLEPIQSFPLKEITLSYSPGRDRAILQKIKTLERINSRPAAEVLK